MYFSIRYTISPEVNRGKQKGDLMIIDIHTHNTASGTDTLIESERDNHVDQIVLLGDVLRFGYYPTEKQIHEINIDTVKAMKKYPGLCCGFCFLNPANDMNFTLEELERCVNEYGFKGVKLEVSVNCRDKRLDSIMKKLDEFHLPLLHHCCYKTVNKCPNESDPSDLACLAHRFPSVKIIMAHLSGCGYRGVEDIVEYPNVYIDTSGGQPIAGLLEYAVKRLGMSRVVFGSDAPYRDIACQLGRIYGAEINEEAKEKVLHGNAEDLLK